MWRWLDSLKQRDPGLHKELSGLQSGIPTPETAFTPESAGHPTALTLETIVREGRPAFLIRDNRIVPDGGAGGIAKTLMERLTEAAPAVEPLIPLVGRIDMANAAGSLTYAGTGWLVERDIVITNRHVADLIAVSDGGTYLFRPGRLGGDLRVTLDYCHEQGSGRTSVVRVKRVVWIEPDPRKADMALLEVDRHTDGTLRDYIPLAAMDVSPDTDVAVIGYPARASAEQIPDQAWMDRIYGGAYDVKRIAPGLMGVATSGWATHDCTTLGGNSGSVVLDLKTGCAAALHFAGRYLVENYAVPASTIRQYLRERPWQNALRPRPAEPSARETPDSPAGVINTNIRMDGAGISVTIPLTITISFGPARVSPATGDSPEKPVEDAARDLFREHREKGVLSVWPSYTIHQGRLTDAKCLVVSAHPARVAAVRDAMPPVYAGFPVEVRPGSIDEQMAAAPGIVEAVTSVAYNDGDRTGEPFSFDWVDEEMSLLLHAGPERSWAVLAEFLHDTKKELISSMYEFHAAHIARAVEHKLGEGASLKLVLARQSRDPASGRTAQGDFDRRATFERWQQSFGEKFERIFVPVGTQGLVANAYHIKVTVRDGEAVWLSSGNWKRTSQPEIAGEQLDNPKVACMAGNREWHVVMENGTLAQRFRNHIQADFQRSEDLGGTEEAVEEDLLVDVPVSTLESVDLEAPPAKVIETRTIKRRVRARPLLTPDGAGEVYSQAVLQLIRSARKQLLFQNQYIKMKGADGGLLDQLVTALAEKSQRLDDFRIILRKPNQELRYDLSQLKRRGVDVNRQVRLLANTHTKGIIVDGTQVLLGSHNWSSSGVTLNRDASMIFDDREVAEYYTGVFEIDWNRAGVPRFQEEAAAEAVRPAEGDAPPRGFARMALSDFLEG